MSQSGPNRFHRVRSDGNLVGLPAAELDEVHISRRHHPVLDTSPSFFVHHPTNTGKEEEAEEEEVRDGDGLLPSVTIGDSITTVRQDFGFGGGKDGSLTNQAIEEESEELTLSINGIGSAASPLFLAGGIGMETTIVNAALAEGYCHGAGAGGFFRSMDSGGSGDGSDLEDHYRRLVEENPCGPLCLTKYAQSLHQVEMDYPKAEEFYRSMRNSSDLHHDHDRPTCHFEQAVQATPNDSHVLAAYARFLREVEEEEEEGKLSSYFHGGASCRRIYGVYKC